MLMSFLVIVLKIDEFIAAAKIKNVVFCHSEK